MTWYSLRRPKDQRSAFVPIALTCTVSWAFKSRWWSIGQCLLAKSRPQCVHCILPTPTFQKYRWMLRHFARQIMGRIQDRPSKSEGESSNGATSGTVKRRRGITYPSGRSQWIHIDNQVETLTLTAILGEVSLC